MRTNAHRRIWERVFGATPSTEIDHINRNNRDNRPENLRLATREENNRNRRLFRNNRSGEKGVIWDRHNRRWQVRVKAGATLVYANAAHKISAIVAARLIRRTLHGEFTCHA